MEKNLYLLQYNNYYNRMIKPLWSNISGYPQSSIVAQVKNMTLWNPNDGVNTTTTSPLEMTAVPDYALLCNSSGDVLQRWFVLESRRIRGGQYTLTLHRDIISDNYETLLDNEDMYIMRGGCGPENDAIYNDENITFNQIKRENRLMYGRGGTPWIVIYFAFRSYMTTHQIQSSNYHITVDPGATDHAKDVPYGIYAMPYDTIDITTSDGTEIQQLKDVSRQIAMALSREFSGSGALIDIQILPFCPIAEMTETSYHKVLLYSQEPRRINIYNDNEQVVGYLMDCMEPSTRGTIYEITESYTTKPLECMVNHIKEDCLTVMSRIVSPNGNGVWEFIPAKQVYQNGQRKGFTYIQTAMPYQPYIKVEPEFGRLYGINGEDQRGMICGGDFSFPQVTDAWKTYQINNKNYNASFNRQIESLDLQNKWAKRQDIAGAVSGTVQGAVGGAITGVLAGGAVGGVIGGVIGGAASGAAGVMDVFANKELRADNRNAMIDQHNMTLQNIQAMPYGVSKATAFNDEQPKVPYLETYSCSDSELENLRRYFALRSYTINRYGSIKNYIGYDGLTWIQAKIIRFDDFKGDTNELAALSDEISQGVYWEV